MKKTGFGFALVASAALTAYAFPALAANWVEYYYHQGTNTHFSYDTANVRRDGTHTYVSWYDNKGITPNETGRREWLVYDVRINCAQRTVQNLRVHRIDVQNGRRIAIVDLQNEPSNRPQAINPGSNMAEHLRSRVC